MRRILTIVASALVGCAGSSDSGDGPGVTCPGEGDYAHADRIVDAPGTVESPSAVNDPTYAVDGVVEGDPSGGATRVFSRGTSTDPPNHYVTLEWTDRLVVDAPGPDLVVFENAFETEGGVFMDPIVVAVSVDGDRWVEFPHDYRADDETSFSLDPADWVGFAGVTPVAWSSADCTDPFAQSAGGDRFDLADLEDPDVADGVRYVRLTSAATVVNPDTGEPFPKYLISDGFDLDGVYAARTSTP